MYSANATAARAREDYDLAASLLDAEKPEHAGLLAEVRAAKLEREAKARRLKNAKRLAVALVAVVLAVVFLLTSALAVVTLGLALWLWRKRAWPVWGRSLYTAFSLVAVAFVPYLSYWNLLGFQW